VKFGLEMRTPAMQAGLARKRLTFRDVFMSMLLFLRLVLTVCLIIQMFKFLKTENRPMFAAT
jgi:hypothetical protein